MHEAEAHTVSGEIAAWEKIHRSRQWGMCPEPAMARFMMRRFGVPDFPSRPRVLDLGCGAGAQTLWLAMNSFIIDAVDVSPAAVERAERFVNRWAPFNGGRFQVADARNLPFDDGLFDAAIDCCCLQHVVDYQDKAIAEAFRVLKPGGWLFSMMASPAHSVAAFGEMSVHPCPGNASTIDAWFGRHGAKEVIVEGYEHTDRGLTIAHWVVEAQKA